MSQRASCLVVLEGGRHPGPSCRLLGRSWPKGSRSSQRSNPDPREPFVEGQLAGSLLAPADPDRVAALFEHGADAARIPATRRARPSPGEQTKGVR